MKKIKKLVLKQETISNLNDAEMKKVQGGGFVSSDNSYDTISADLPGYCGAASHYNECNSYIATGTGYGMCCCNATGICG